MPTLNDEHRRHILEGLACFDTPSTVRDSVKEEFGLELALNQITYYDPGTRAGRGLAARWKEYFAECRKAFVEETATIPIALRAFRLRELEYMLRKAMKRENFVLAAQLLEQAAKEVGGIYSNYRVIDGRLRHWHSALSSEEIDAAGIDELVDGYLGVAGVRRRTQTGVRSTAAHRSIPHGRGKMLDTP